jgi:hypothetical protein
LNHLPSDDDIPEAYEDEQVDLFDNERFARAASGIDRTQAFLSQLRGGVKAPAGFTAQQFLTRRSNLSLTSILTELGKTAIVISGLPPQNFKPAHKGLISIINTDMKPEYKRGAGPLTEWPVGAQGT